MTDKQRRSVRALTKQAGISPTTTKVAPNHPFLAELAPGERVFVETSSINMHPAPERSKGPRKSDGPRQYSGHRKGSGGKPGGGEKKYGSAGKQRNKYRGDRKPR
jgi:hypothetical protein